jgi:cytoskeletal protein RodZ
MAKLDNHLNVILINWFKEIFFIKNRKKENTLFLLLLLWLLVLFLFLILLLILLLLNLKKNITIEKKP